MIEVNHLRKSFGDTVAVDDVSFTVKPGEVLGFLGPNGAGKTTTMRVLTCYMPPESGSIRVAGHDVVTESLEVRRRLGYLPESAPLYLDMETVEYLRYIGSLRGLRGDRLRRRIRDMVDACGIGKVVGRPLGQLSKGYRQRVGLAQALIHDPEFLVLDEPTSGLDPNQIAEIRTLIREIGRTKTILLSTHILPEVQITCSRVVIISEGRIVGMGTPDELTSRAGGQDLYRYEVRADPAAVRRVLDAAPEVSRHELAGEPEDGVARLRVHARQGADISEELFRMAVDNGWVLRELSREQASLEDVFAKLTLGEGGSPSGASEGAPS